MSQERGPEPGLVEREIDELFSRELAAHPLILAITTGQIDADNIAEALPATIQGLGLILSVHRQALSLLAREIDDLRRHAE